MRTRVCISAIHNSEEPVNRRVAITIITATTTAALEATNRENYNDKIYKNIMLHTCIYSYALLVYKVKKEIKNKNRDAE